MRANEILHSKDAKQSICNQILGCTYKEVERVMLSVIQSQSISDRQREQMELQKSVPEKFDPEIEFKVSSKIFSSKEASYASFTPEECALLLLESNRPAKQPKSKNLDIDYPVYSLEETQELFGEKIWDSTKTTE